MSKLRLSLEDDRAAFEPGAGLRVTAEWELERPPPALELELGWHTEGKGTQDAELAAVMRLDDPGARGRHRFELRLPEAPWSFSGRLVSLVWTLELQAGPRGPRASRALVIAPGAREIELPEGPPGERQRGKRGRWSRR